MSCAATRPRRLYPWRSGNPSRSQCAPREKQDKGGRPRKELSEEELKAKYPYGFRWETRQRTLKDGTISTYQIRRPRQHTEAKRPPSQRKILAAALKLSVEEQQALIAKASCEPSEDASSSPDGCTSKSSKATQRTRGLSSGPPADSA